MVIRRWLLVVTAIAGGAVLGGWWWQRPVPVAVDLLLVRGAAWDPTARNSAELFLEERPGSRIRLVNLFNTADPADSPGPIAALKRRGVRFFLSTHPSSHALASLQEFRGGKALAINAAAASSTLSGRDDDFLRVVPDVHQEQRVIAQAVHRLPVAAGRQGRPRRLLVLQDTANPAYGSSALKAFCDELERLGGWQVEVRRLRVEAMAPGRDRQLLQADVDAVYILAGLFQPSIGNLSQLVQREHPGVPILLTPWARSPELISRVGEARATTLLTSSFPARRESAAVNRYLERFERRFGYTPNALALSTRQAIELLDQALASGAQTPAQVKRYLLSKPEHRTSLGPVRLDADGDRSATFHVFAAAADIAPSPERLLRENESVPEDREGWKQKPPIR